jgi:hypothetical protein
MNQIIKDEQMSENSAIDNLVAEYQVAARKSCRSILEVAKCVQHARTVLSIKSDFHAYLERIVVSESDAKKLCVVAEYESQIEDFLSRTNTELSFSAMYNFAQLLKDNSAEDVAKTNVLELRTAKDFAAANTAKVAKAETKKAVKAVQAAKEAKAEMPKADVEVEAVVADFDSKAEAVVVAVTSNADAYVLRVSRLSSDKQVALFNELNALRAKYDFEIEIQTAEALALAA